MHVYYDMYLHMCLYHGTATSKIIEDQFLFSTGFSVVKLAFEGKIMQVEKRLSKLETVKSRFSDLKRQYVCLLILCKTAV
jgi:hypothetical protein